MRSAHRLLPTFRQRLRLMMCRTQQLALSEFGLKPFFRGGPHPSNFHSLGSPVVVVKLKIIYLRALGTVPSKRSYCLGVPPVVPALHVLAHVGVSLFTSLCHKLRLALLCR